MGATEASGFKIAKLLSTQLHGSLPASPGQVVVPARDDMLLCFRLNFRDLANDVIARRYDDRSRRSRQAKAEAIQKLERTVDMQPPAHLSRLKEL